MDARPYYLTAGEASAALGVTRATLYAYASRGQVRSEPLPGGSRQRGYHCDDVERLRERKEVRRDPSGVAARRLHWGRPVLESAITLIHDGHLYYRGRDAVGLAETATPEQVAALLWEADDADPRPLFEQPDVLGRQQVARLRTVTKDPFGRLQASLAMAGAVDVASFDLRPPAVRQTGARILRLLTTVLTRRSARKTIHRALQVAWAPRDDAVGDVIRAALVLCADHELNVSAFSARCAASAGAAPYDVVAAALATLRGYKHGGAAERVLALLAASGTRTSARAAVADQLRRGEAPPGFGHPLYPAGDPRAAVLIRLAEAGVNRVEWRRVRNVLTAGSELLHDRPNLDFGLAAVTRAYGLPDNAPLLLFALGRTMGWIAHAIEEYASGALIRPRARYTGPAPEGGST